MVLVYCGIWAPILKILSNYLIFTVAFVTWDKHIDKYVRWAHIIVSQWHNLTQAQGYIWHMSIQMIVFGFTLDTLDNNWVCYSFECVPDTPDQILSPVPDTPVKWYFQYQTHQTRMSNIISSTSLTSQILFPVPDTPAVTPATQAASATGSDPVQIWPHGGNYLHLRHHQRGRGVCHKSHK